MAFTNNDLKRLEDCWVYADHKHDLGACLDNSWFYALIARLEAAEECAKWLRAHDDKDLCPLERTAIEEWRKAKGGGEMKRLAKQ